MEIYRNNYQSSLLTAGNRKKHECLCPIFIIFTIMWLQSNEPHADWQEGKISDCFSVTHTQISFYPKFQLVIMIWKKHLIKEKPHLCLHQPHEWSTGLRPETMPPSCSVYLILSAVERDSMKTDTVCGGSFGSWTQLAITLTNCCCHFIKRMILFGLRWLQGTSWWRTPLTSSESYYFLKATPTTQWEPDR